MAERAGFEPAGRFKQPRLSKPLPWTSRPTLLDVVAAAGFEPACSRLMRPGPYRLATQPGRFPVTSSGAAQFLRPVYAGARLTRSPAWVGCGRGNRTPVAQAYETWRPTSRLPAVDLAFRAGVEPAWSA